MVLLFSAAKQNKFKCIDNTLLHNTVFPLPLSSNTPPSLLPIPWGINSFVKGQRWCKYGCFTFPIQNFHVNLGIWT